MRVSADSARGLLHAKVVGMGLKVDAREVVQPQLRLQEAAGDDGLLQGARACHSRLSSRVDVATAGFRREALGLYSDLP